MELEKEMSKVNKVYVPNIGDFNNVEVIEVDVHPGEHVEQEDALITIESNKALMEIPSPYTGTVNKIKVKVGDRISQGDLLLSIETKEKIEKIKDFHNEIETDQEDNIARLNKVKEEKHDEYRVYASPLVKKLAKKLKVNLENVRGTGYKNRITKKDLEKFVKGRKVFAKQKQESIGAQFNFEKYGEIETKPLLSLKKIANKRLLHSWQTIPHVSQFAKADITRLEKLRKKDNKSLSKEKIHLTLLPYLISAIVKGLKKYPIFNSSLDSTGENLIYKTYINIGIAIHTKDGLVVPVIHNADQKNKIELSKQIMTFKEKAEKRQFKPEDMRGGSFTITNLGKYNVGNFTPIINWPEVAILGIAHSVKQSIKAKGGAQTRLFLPLSLTYDHRVIDGAIGAEFLAYIIEILSKPGTHL